jgi:hypothetical protein
MPLRAADYRPRDAEHAVLYRVIDQPGQVPPCASRNPLTARLSALYLGRSGSGAGGKIRPLPRIGKISDSALYVAYAQNGL